MKEVIDDMEWGAVSKSVEVLLRRSPARIAVSSSGIGGLLITLPVSCLKLHCIYIQARPTFVCQHTCIRLSRPAVLRGPQVEKLAVIQCAMQEVRHSYKHKHLKVAFAHLPQSKDAASSPQTKASPNLSLGHQKRRTSNDQGPAISECRQICMELPVPLRRFLLPRSLHT